MKKTDYRPRIIDSKIEQYLSAFGAVCIEGPKWCGKTWTSEFHSKSSIFLGDPAGNFQNRTLAQTEPPLVLQGDSPRLIDEWQEVPSLWDAVRFAVDKSERKGRFILTGSATPNHKGILHSGAGRIARLRMNPMSLYESGDSTGTVSLQELCCGILNPAVTGEVSLKKLIDLIIRGGWPATLGISMQEAALLPEQYLNAVLNDDVYRLDNKKRDTHKIKLLLRSLARNESTTATNKTLKNDIKEIDDDDIDAETVAVYLDVINRLFITDNIPPFGTKIRSSVRVKQAEKRHFCDPSLVCSLLKVNADMLINDLTLLGFLFESLCERDLKIYADSFGAHVYHYQDYNNREIDAAVELSNGTWAAFEIKLGANEIDSAAENLLSITESIEHDKNGGRKPAVLCVICGMSNAAYRRADGVFVVPITALKN